MRFIRKAGDVDISLLLTLCEIIDKNILTGKFYTVK